MTEHIGLEQFEAAEALRERFGSNTLAVFTLQTRFGVDNPNELEDAVTDGEEDKCCDLLYVHEPTGTAVIAQAYFASEPKDVPKVGKAADLNTAVSWVLDPSNREQLQPPLKSAAELLDVALRDGSIETIELWFSHNCGESPDADEELAQAAKTADALLRMHLGDDIGIDVRPVQVGLETLDMWCAQSQFAILISDVIEVPAESYFEESGDDWRAVCVSVPGEFLKSLLEHYTPERLFSGNIREYLGRRRSARNINFGIERTATDAPGEFFVFNNGITALVNKIDSSDGKLRIHGITIVNGAQTTGALNRATKIEGVHVLARLVECSDPAVIEDIIRFNNTQNAIAPSDFRSRDPHQQRLRDGFAAIPQVRYTAGHVGECRAMATREWLSLRATKRPRPWRHSTSRPNSPITARAGFGRRTRSTRASSTTSRPRRTSSTSSRSPAPFTRGSGLFGRRTSCGTVIARYSTFSRIEVRHICWLPRSGSARS